MHPKCPKWLSDMREACELIQGATRGKTLADYENDRLLRSAVERNFEIIGEALNRIDKTDAETAGRIPEHEAIISFRNVLIHGYDYVDHSRVWCIVEKDVPKLRERVDLLLQEAVPPPSVQKEER